MSTITNVQGFLTDNKKDALIPVRVDLEMTNTSTRITMHDHNRAKNDQLDMTLEIKCTLEKRPSHEEE